MWTYFIQGVDGGPIKIGKTRTSPEDRKGNMQTGSPVQLRVVAYIEGDVENVLHIQFAESRLHGEWFTPSPELLEFIATDSRVIAFVEPSPHDDCGARGNEVHSGLMWLAASITNSAWHRLHPGDDGELLGILPRDETEEYTEADEDDEEHEHNILTMVEIDMFDLHPWAYSFVESTGTLWLFVPRPESDIGLRRALDLASNLIADVDNCNAPATLKIFMGRDNENDAVYINGVPICTRKQSQHIALMDLTEPGLLVPMRELLKEALQG